MLSELQFRIEKFLHEKCYEDAKRLFNLNTALIQTARDKAAEILKSFEENKEEKSVLRLKRISIHSIKDAIGFQKRRHSDSLLAHIGP